MNRVHGFFNVFYICLFFTFVSGILGVSAEEKTDLANRLYEKGDYKAAIAEYEKILITGYESGNLYYNLGNSYFKDGQSGKAILNYKRARRLIPRDSDLMANYRYALSQTRRASEPGRTLTFRFLDAIGRHFTLNELAIFLSALFFIFAGLVLVRIYFNLVKTYFLISTAVTIILFIVVGLAAVNEFAKVGREAVLVVKEVNSKFEPLERATTHFTLYEGATVTVLDAKDDWYKVKRPDGKIGWIAKSAIELI